MQSIEEEESPENIQLYTNKSLEHIDLDLNNTIPEEHSLNHRKFSYSEAGITDLNVSEDEGKDDFLKKFPSQNNEESRIKYVKSILIPSKDNIQKDLETWKKQVRALRNLLRRLKSAIQTLNVKIFKLLYVKYLRQKTLKNLLQALHN